MTGFQPVQSLFPTQGTSAAGILGGGTAAGGDGATDLFTQLLSGMVEADNVGSQSAGQGTAFLGTSQGATSPFTPSTVPFATGKAGATGKNGIAPAGTTTGTAVTALMTGITANSPSALQAGTGWTQTHWSAATATTDAVTTEDGKDAATSPDGTTTDATLAALAAGAQQQPLPTPAPTPAAPTPSATGQAAQDATKIADLTAAKGADAALAQTAAGQTPLPQGGTTEALSGTQAQAEGAGTAALAGMTPVGQPTAADATLAAQAAAALSAGQATTTPTKGSAAASAATSLAVADQKAAALAAGTPVASARAATAGATPAPTPSAPTSPAPTAATAQAQKAQTDAAALAATTAAVAAGTVDAKMGKADGVSGSGLKGGTPNKANAKGDTVKLPGVSVSATATDQKAGAADTADQTRQQTADSATDGNGSNGLLANTSGEGMIYADTHAAAPLTKMGDAATPAAAPMAALATVAGGGTAATATQTATATAQATLQTLLQQQQAGRTNTASNGLLVTTENGLLPAAAETTGTSTSASDAALNASGFMGLVDGQHTFATGFAAQMAGTSQAARPPQYPPVLQQVTMGFQKAASNGMDSVTIQLSPDDMGSIDVKLDFHKDGKVHASVTADNAKTLDLLQRNSDDLKNALQDAGLQTDSDSLSFNLKDDSEAQQQQERRSGSRGQQFSMDDTATTEDAASENIIIPSLGRVDVRI
ncbi:flagellar hook-length control protein FliK [Nitrospirillum pindoramense]|uniref:Flagellar hook-length control protein FliK n=1 Tax=Nitrospirillum amazonense TaxID=28077 RepID=A0A560HF33_9PROT|nr:flagellar hook-length control protein FliK [Nitrospirillum amazonense]TWB44249.1 flagellar hook-length control protein FliK [Nitrospirillum amazonense]